MLAAVRSDAAALALAAPSLKADRDFILEAVRVDGAALRHAAEALRIDRELLRQAGEARQLKSKVCRVTAARVWSYVRECS